MDDLHSSVLNVLKALHFSKKAYTPKTFSKATNTPLEFIEKFFSVLENITYIKLKKSPSGRIIRYYFYPFSEDIYYYDITCIIKAGRVIRGKYNSRRDIYDDYDYKYLTSNLPDEAKANNKLLISYGLSEEQLAEEIVKILTPIEERVEDNSFALTYPLVHENLLSLEEEKKTLEEEVQREIQSNEDKKKWFDTETYKANHGQRTKLQYDTVIVSYQDSYQLQYNRYWFDDDPVREYVYVGKEPVFETRTKTVIDFPEEPKYLFEKQEKNKSLIYQLTHQIKELRDYPIKYEDILKKEKEKQQQLSILERKKMELEQEIRKLKAS